VLRPPGGDPLFRAPPLERLHGALPRALDQEDLFQGGDVAREVLDLLQHFLLGYEEDLDFGVLDDVFPHGQQLLFVHGDVHGAQALHRHLSDEPLLPVVRDDPDGVARLDPDRGQTRPQIVHPERNLAVGHPLVLARTVLFADQQVVRIPGDAVFEDLHQVVGGIVFVPVLAVFENCH